MLRSSPARDECLPLGMVPVNMIPAACEKFAG